MNHNIEINELWLKEVFLVGESQTVEFKTFLREPGVVAKVIAAFANTEGGALIIGYDERVGAAIGVDIEQITPVISRAVKSLAPVPNYKLNQVDYQGKVVAVVSVEKSDSVVTVDGAVWVREGELVRAASADKILGLIKGKDKEKTLAESISKLTDAIEKLQEKADVQTELIDSLREELQQSKSLKSKGQEWVYAGIVGALIGKLLFS